MGLEVTGMGDGFGSDGDVRHLFPCSSLVRMSAHVTVIRRLVEVRHVGV